MPTKSKKLPKSRQKAHPKAPGERTRRAPRAKVARLLRPLTRQQKDREHVLIECEITKADIARLLGVSEQAIANIFRDRSRSIGALEPGIVRILNRQKNEIVRRDPSIAEMPITCESMGWPQGLLSPEGETADWAKGPGAPSIAPMHSVRCPECGSEQADMGENVECEACGYGPMPSSPLP